MLVGQVSNSYKKQTLRGKEYVCEVHLSKGNIELTLTLNLLNSQVLIYAPKKKKFI